MYLNSLMQQYKEVGDAPERRDHGEFRAWQLSQVGLGPWRGRAKLRQGLVEKGCAHLSLEENIHGAPAGSAR
jgi:hypothetical protein